MRICRVLTIGMLMATGCSSTSPFATTSPQPVPIAAQVASHSQAPPGGSGPGGSNFGGRPQQQLTQTGPNSYGQSPANPGNPFLASLRSTSASIGDALTIDPKVIPAADATSLASQTPDVGADLHCRAAQVYEGQQNISAAISHYQKALAISPGEPRILVGFGRLYDRQNDLHRAQGYYQQALQLDPNHCPALNALGISYAKQGNLDAAIAHISKAAQLQPASPRYKNNLANVLVDAGRTGEAYTQLASVHGEAVAHYNLGYLLLQQGKTDLARQELGLALQANPYLQQARQVLNSLEVTPGPGFQAAAGVEPGGQYSVSKPVNAPAHSVSTPRVGTQPQFGRPQSLPPL